MRIHDQSYARGICRTAVSLALLFGVAVSGLGQEAGEATLAKGIPIGKVSLTGSVEKQAGRAWKRIDSGYLLRTGDRLRTDGESLVRLEMPWTAVVAAPSTVASIPLSTVLAIELEDGRLDQLARGGDILKMRTREALIRGTAGRVIVRRQQNTTWIAAIRGSYRIEMPGRVLFLSAGYGTRIPAGGVPTPPTRLPSAPIDISPGGDPAYVVLGQSLPLSWSATEADYHLQVRVVDTDEIVFDRDVGRPPYQLRLPWLGTYGWQVSTRDAQGGEGQPSQYGYFSVVEK